MKKWLYLLPLVFLPALSVFFSSDDWFHLRVSHIDSLGQFLNFFSFEKTFQSISFYRPLTTQVFFFVFQRLFGLNPVPYHLFVLAVFLFSLYLVYKLAHKLLQNRWQANVTVLLYGFSVSNFTRLYFLSAFQEIGLVVFSLLSILSYLRSSRKPILAVLFFVLALLSKETAAVLPVILIALDYHSGRLNWRRTLPFFLILAPYLYLRFSQFGAVSGESYVWDFSPVKIANTLMWYVLWSIGAPELLVDYIGSGLKPVPRLFIDFPVWSFIILSLLLMTTAFLTVMFVKKIKSVDGQFILFAFLFIISLGPLLFLPQHKFSLELGLPLVWFSLATALFLPAKGKLPIAFLALYLVLNLSMNYLTYLHHYSVQRGIIARNVHQYITANYPQKPESSYFEFINDTLSFSPEWGSSKQISQAIGGSEMFRVVYSDPDYIVYFEDYPGKRPKGIKIALSTKMFLP